MSSEGGSVPLDDTAGQSNSDATKKTRIAFIDIGRALGAILVFYSHIAEQWVGKRDEPSSVFDVLNTLSSDPMHMGFQGIGEIAVPFFFLVSGFVVTPIALRQGQGRFALNRICRVYPPMIFTVLLTALLLGVGVELLTTGQQMVISPLTLFTNSVLVNYLIFPQVVLVGVAWTLVVEVIFYIMLTLLLPVFRRVVWLALSIELVFVFVALMSRNGQYGTTWSLFTVNVSYLPIPIIGQIIWATTTKRIPLWLGALFGTAAWGLYVLGDVIKLGRVDDSYSLALAFAVLCFLMGMFAEPKLKQRKVWTALSERSYSLYLLHGVVAFLILDLLRPAVPLLLAVVAAVVATFGVVELSYRLVEGPSHKLARRLSRKPKPKPEPAPVVEDKAEFADVPVRSSEYDFLRDDATTVLPAVGRRLRRPPPPQAEPPHPPASPRRLLANGRPVEQPTQYIPVVSTSTASSPSTEPESGDTHLSDRNGRTRRRHLRKDSVPPVTVATLLANHAKENGNQP